MYTLTRNIHYLMFPNVSITESGKYNHESTQVSSGTTLQPVVSELNPGYAHSNAGTPRVSPKGTPDLSRQQDGL